MRQINASKILDEHMKIANKLRAQLQRFVDDFETYTTMKIEDITIQRDKEGKAHVRLVFGG